MPHRRRSEIERLYRAEYPSAIELSMRFAILAVGSAILYLYTGWTSALLWLPIYFALHLLHWRFLKTHVDSSDPGDLNVAALLYLVIMASFLWMPVCMALVDDPPLQFSAVALMIATLVFLIWRGDTQPLLVMGKTALVAAAAVLITAHHMANVADVWVAGAMALSGAAAVTYFHIAQIAVRNRIKFSRRAAIHQAEAQKLEAIGRISSGIAHDFNNLLTAIRGNLELARMVATRQDREDLLVEAQLAADRAADLVRHLLSYARTARITPELVDLQSLTDEIQMLSDDLIPASTPLSVMRPSSSLHLVTDQAQLVTALLALILNAAEAQESRPGTPVTLSIADSLHMSPQEMLNGRILPAGRYVQFTVRDSGPGIPASVLPHVAEPFFTTKPPGTGSGMGLAMVSGFAEQSGGGIVIETAPSGTAVHLYLPPDSPAARGSGAATGRQLAQAAEKAHKARVLPH
ncbi:sensor histidine kinase [Arenibacterium halophilum]|nr:ATP-binding protein [Arenibacterium halophilum]